MKQKLLYCLMLLVGVVIQIQAQEQSITGTVTDDKQNPLPGMNIFIRGTTIGTITDVDGKFKVNVPKGSTLVIQGVGFEAQEILIGDQTTLSITLKEFIKNLNEVVVTAIGIERETNSLGYNIQSLKTEDLNATDNPNGFINALQGKLAGVQITSSTGAPGSSTRILLRGVASITQGNQPLIVVDGIPIDNSNFNTFASGTDGHLDGGNKGNDLNPEDIASVEVINGVRGANLYGSRGANGLILITTKSGRDAADRGKKAELTYSFSASFSNPLRLPDFQNVYPGGTNGAFNETSGNSYGPRAEFIQSWIYDDVFGDEVNVNIAPDNIKDFYETGSVFTHNLSLAGGNASTDYRVSFSNSNQEGIVPNTDFKRTNISLNAGHRFNNKFRARTSIQYIESGSENRPLAGQNQTFGRTFLFLQRHTDLTQYRDFENPDGSQRGALFNFFDNPYWALNNNTYDQKTRRVLGNLTLTYEPFEWLNFNMRAGVDSYGDDRFQRWAVGSFGARNVNGRFFEDRYNVRDLNIDFFANFNKALTEDIKLDVLAGMNIRDRRVTNLNVDARGLNVPGIYNLANISDRNNIFTANTISERRLYGFYGNATISYKNYLFLGLSARNDWSSTLPTSNNTFFYPGVDVSFILTELVQTNPNLLSYAKLRLGWAQAGIDAAAYAINTTFVQSNIRGFLWNGVTFPIVPDGGPSSGQNIPGFSQSTRLGDPNLQPEITTEIEFGTDLGFWNDKITLNATYYIRKSSEQILNVAVPNSTGYRFFTTNSGELENKGLELAVNAIPIANKDFRWEIGWTFTRNRNKITKLADGVDALRIFAAAGTVFTEPDIRATVGKPYGEIYGIAFRRNEQGQLLLGDNGLPQPDASPQTLGNVQPDYIMGLSSTVSYKGISLYVLFQTQQGGDLFSFGLRSIISTGQTVETLNNRETGFIVDGVLESTNAPSDIAVSPEDYYNIVGGISENWTYDATYYKLRELRLGYSLPNTLLTKTPFGSVNVAFIANNLWLFGTNVPHIDPEVGFYNASSNRVGVDFGGTPSTRSFGFNVRFTL